MNDYNRAASSNRFGAMQELQDTYQVLTLAKEPSFNISIDKANNSDQQMMKKAGQVMSAQIKEQIVPYCDKHILKKWAAGAGYTIELPATVTGNALIEALLAVETHYDNTFVDVNERYVAIKNADLALLRGADRWQYCDNLTEKFLVKGNVKVFGTLKVFGMPDAWFPTKVRAVAFQKKAVLAPMKLKTARILEEVPDLDGSLLQGHYYFDAFVIGRRCDGVVAIVDNTYKAATPTVTKGQTTTAIASTTASANIYYTVDGSDPRYSNTRVTYSAAITNPAAGVVIKAVAEKIGTGNIYWSDVVVHTCV